MCLYSSSWSPLNDSENGQEAQINVLSLFSLWALSTLAVWFPKKTSQWLPISSSCRWDRQPGNPISGPKALVIKRQAATSVSKQWNRNCRSKEKIVSQNVGSCSPVLLRGCVNWGKSYHLSGLQFLHLGNGFATSSRTVFLRVLNERMATCNAHCYVSSIGTDF